MRLSTVVLAGGKSSRAGGENKSFFLYEDQTIIERILVQLAGFDEVFISVGANKSDYLHLPYELVEDEVLDAGPMGGLHASLKHCCNKHLFVCATDMPNIKKELVEYMAGHITDSHDCFILQTGERAQPLCAIYTKALVPHIETLLASGKHKLYGLCDNSKIKYIPLDYTLFDDSVVHNINYRLE